MDTIKKIRTCLDYKKKSMYSSWCEVKKDKFDDGMSSQFSAKVEHIFCK